jgi:hypothetical protein
MPTVNHQWADNAMRCCAHRIQQLRAFDNQSWAMYRIMREQETLNKLYSLYYEHDCYLND